MFARELHETRPDLDDRWVPGKVHVPTPLVTAGHEHQWEQWVGENGGSKTWCSRCGEARP